MNALIKGSISDVAKRNNQSLAESFLSAEMVVLADTSGSMSVNDVSGFSSRFDALCSHLKRIQGGNDGKVALVSFSGMNQVAYCPNGYPHNFGGGTDLGGALEFIKVADDCGLKIVVISDGEPDSKRHALDIAKSFSTKIDVIFCGKDGSDGYHFLQDLARATGGKFAANHVDVGQELQLLLTG